MTRECLRRRRKALKLTFYKEATSVITNSLSHEVLSQRHSLHKPSHLLKVPPLNIVPSGIKFPTHEFWIYSNHSTVGWTWASDVFFFEVAIPFCVVWVIWSLNFRYWQVFIVKGQIISILGFMSHIPSLSLFLPPFLLRSFLLSFFFSISFSFYNCLQI